MTLICIPEEIKSEFSVSEDGKAYASRRATARLVGIKSHATIKKLLENLVDHKSPSVFLEPFTGNDFVSSGVDHFLPDTLVAAIIQHYAHKGREHAQKSLMAFAAIGIRTWIQQELNWQAPKQIETLDPFDARAIKSEFFDLKLLVKSCTDYFPWEYGERIKALEEKTDRTEQELEEIKKEHYYLEGNYDRLNAEHQKLEKAYTDLVKQREYRAKINVIMKQICNNNDGYQKAYWNGLYGELIAQTGFEVYAAAKLWHCSCLDAVEIQGLMPKLYHIASEFILR